MGWTFCSLTTEGAGSNRISNDALENGKVVDTQNVKSCSEFRPILQ